MKARFAFASILLALVGAASALAVPRPASPSLKAPVKKVLACGPDCSAYLKSYYEAKAAVEAGSTYSEVRCETLHLEKSPPFRVGPRYARSLGGGRGLINARITIRCVPYSGRDPVILIRNFTFDAHFHICERASLEGRVDRHICPSLN